VSKPRLLDLFCGAGGAAMGSDVDLAWAAGFFDGEGSVSVHRDRRPGRAVVVHLDIEQVDPRPLVRFRAAVGRPGAITLRPARAPNRRAIHRVYMGHSEAIATLQALWPYLSEPKREQAERVLRAVEEAA